MDELSKIDRVLGRELPDAARETLLVLDSTTGQNAVIQAQEFKNSADITGLVQKGTNEYVVKVNCRKHHLI